MDISTLNEIAISQNINNLSLGTYSYTAISIDGYTLSDNLTKSITLTQDNPNQTIIFNYSEILGSIVIKYLNRSLLTEIIPSDTFSNLKLGSYTYNAKDISGYKLSGSISQTIVLTTTAPNQNILFNYDEILGSVIVKYIEENYSIELLNSMINNNLSLGTYSYNSESIDGYSLINNSTQFVTLTESNPNQVITFLYTEILGSVTINYLDEITGKQLHDSKIYDNLKLGNYSYDSIAIDGYVIIGDLTKTINLTSEIPNVVIDFKYTKLLGTVTINYIDKDSSAYIVPSKTYSNLILGSYKYTAKTFDNYNLSDDSEKTVTLTTSNPSQIISFIYSKVLGSVTINYIDEATLAPLISPSVISNLEIGTYSYSSISINNYLISGNATESVNITKTNPNQTITFKYNLISDTSTLIKVPYISTYYFKTKPTIDEEITIPFYATNYEQSEYLYDETVKLDILYQIDNGLEKVITVTAGDNTLNLGKLPEGEQYFSIQALDKTNNLKSHKLYNEILVVNPNNYNISSSQTYIITDTDLNNYNISRNNSTDTNTMTNTRTGLSSLFSDLQLKGYRKCVLPLGTYRIDNGGRTNCITIPTKFTVDMNGSTFKLNTIMEHQTPACIVNFYNSYDSHLINGILEGDRFERKALGFETGYNGEPINTVYFYGGKYSGINNLTIKATTGHTIFSVSGESAGGVKITSFEKTLIYNGKNINSALWSTSEYIFLDKFIKNYLTVGTVGGYRGIKGKSLSVYYNFYDSNKDFIEMIVGYQYRKTLIPPLAKYVRVSIYGDLSQSDNVSIFYRELGTNMEYTNINFIDTRTTAIATATCNGLLIDNVTFTRCGNSITPTPVDFEDGWQECQDIYFRNCSLLEEGYPNSNTLIDNVGYNHIYENNENFRYLVRYSTIGLVIKNNKNITGIRWVRGSETGSAYSRITNNIINIFLSPSDDTDNMIISTLINDNTANGSIETSTKTFSFKSCNLIAMSGERGKFITCNIQPAPYLKDDFIFENCIFYNMSDINSLIKFSFNKTDAKRIFISCTFKSITQLASHNYFNSGTFTNCIFEKDVTINPNSANAIGDLKFEQCVFKKNTTIKITTSNCFIQFINCSFEGSKIFTGTYGQSNSIFI